MGLKPHFMISDSDGGLYDTRAANWAAKPLRPDFARHFRDIETAAQFKATLRAGGYCWPGGYPLFFICHDGGALCFDCARAEARNVLDSILGGHRDGWRVVACDIAHDGEGDGVTCDHCAEEIAAPAEEDSADGN